MTQPEPQHPPHTTDRSGDVDHRAYGHTVAGSAAPSGPLLFALCLVLLVAGFWLMAISFDHGSGAIFWAGLIVAGLSFAIPLQLKAR